MVPSNPSADAGSQSGSSAEAQAEALHAAAQGLLSLHHRVVAPDGEACARAVAQIGTVLMEQSPEDFAKNSAEVTSRLLPGSL